MYCNTPFTFPFKAANIDTICRALTHTATQHCPDLEDMDQGVANKYGKAFLLYSKCQGEFNSSKLFTSEMLTSFRKL